MKVGDLIRVKLPTVRQYVGIAIKLNGNGGAFVRSIDGKLEYWAASWNSEVISASR